MEWFAACLPLVLKPVEARCFRSYKFIYISLLTIGQLQASPKTAIHRKLEEQSLRRYSPEDSFNHHSFYAAYRFLVCVCALPCKPLKWLPCPRDKGEGLQSLARQFESVRRLETMYLVLRSRLLFRRCGHVTKIIL